MNQLEIHTAMFVAPVAKHCLKQSMTMSAHGVDPGSTVL